MEFFQVFEDFDRWRGYISRTDIHVGIPDFGTVLHWARNYRAVNRLHEDEADDQLFQV